MVRSVLSWFWSILHEASSQMVWISHLQLFVDYASSTGEIGPIKLDGWKNGSLIANQSLLPASFKNRTRWFAKVLKECARHLGIRLATAYCRPHSHMIAMFTGCIAVPWPDKRISLVDQWFRSFSDVTFRRQSKAIDTLPVPSRNFEFDEVFISSCD